MKSKRASFFSHETLEKNVGWLILATIAVVSIAGLVQIVPLFFQHSTTTPVQGVEPYTALRLAGRDVYIREGCVGCHSQQVRTLAAEVQRYGHYSEAGEGVYDRPFLWGSKRTGPDLACPIPMNGSRVRPPNWPARPRRTPWWPTSRVWAWR